MKKVLMTALLAMGAAGMAQAQTACNASFSIAQTSSTPSIQVAVTNNSTYSSPNASTYAYGYINYGDGSNVSWTGPGMVSNHTYGAPGTYTVWLSNIVTDSMTQQVFCIDSVSQSITVTQNPVSGNSISGAVHWDQSAIPDSIDYFKVWLIQYDASANTLTAVDSTIVNPWSSYYVFNNHPSGDYLTKAAPSYGNNPIPSYGFVPTYHDSSLYWSGATTITHFSQQTIGKDIWMRLGTPTSGPGFIGGNISQGAGKGTGTGVAGMLVFLRDNANNQLVASAYTDADGNYAFNNIPNGSYNVYPEEMSYATTPSAILSIASGNTSSTGIDFVQTDDEIIPTSTLSIDGISKNDGISIYPNPVTDRLIIDNKNNTFNQVTVVNTLGQVVKKSSLQKGNNKLETSTLQAGIYYVVVNGNSGARSMKIVKK